MHEEKSPNVSKNKLSVTTNDISAVKENENEIKKSEDNKTVEKTKINGEIKKPMMISVVKATNSKDEGEKNLNKTPKNSNVKNFDIKAKDKIEKETSNHIEKNDDVKKDSDETLTNKKSKNNVTEAKKVVFKKPADDPKDKEKNVKKEDKPKKDLKPTVKIEKKEGKIKIKIFS